MPSESLIYILDDNQERGDKLVTILNFMGKHCGYADYQHPQLSLLSNAQIVIVGAHPSAEETLDLLHELLSLVPNVPVILVSPPLITVPESIHNVLAHLAFPFSYEDMLESLYKCQSFMEQNIMLRANSMNALLFRSLVGNSEPIRRVRKLIEQVAGTEANVLILGESGTGKEVVARNIHALSTRASQPFIPVNCGAIPSELLESELFGHEKGSFTGAVTSRLGRFELANGGTLFLDEIGDMPLNMQVKLLRVLQERCFERVGSNKSIHVDVRILSATHRNLEQDIQKGRFRQDLYYRLNVFPIEVPSLRIRKNDIAILLHELVRRMESEQKPGIRIMPGALELLERYPWPGNIRELSNLVERLSILFPDKVLDKEDLPLRFRMEGQSPENLNPSIMAPMAPTLENKTLNLKEYLLQTELSIIQKALDDSKWVVARAAKLLRMRRTTLVEKMRKHGLVKPKP